MCFLSVHDDMIALRVGRSQVLRSLWDQSKSNWSLLIELFMCEECKVLWTKHKAKTNAARLQPGLQNINICAEQNIPEKLLWMKLSVFALWYSSKRQMNWNLVAAVRRKRSFPVSVALHAAASQRGNTKHLEMYTLDLSNSFWSWLQINCGILC